LGERVTIDRRFRGPPDSAQGGYACGLVAQHVQASCAAVSLRLPPPLEQPLEVKRGDDDAVSLMDGDRLIAEGGPAELQLLDIPGARSLEEARRASVSCPWTDRHPFPGCFGCGPERSQDEAVAIVMGPLPDHELFAAPWTPLADFAGADGSVSPLFVWAALDCPTAAPAVPSDAPASVLARLTGCLVAPVIPERPHTVVSWLIGHDGRKHRGGAAIHGPDSELCAYSEGLWIELRDPAAMGART
jgi:hypothetical protein